MCVCVCVCVCVCMYEKRYRIPKPSLTVVRPPSNYSPVASIGHSI